MNPRTWSAKAQALAVIAVAAVVAGLNAYFGWHIDAQTILGMFGLAGAGALAVAHIDNGEPPDATTPPAAPKPPLTDADRATFAKFGMVPPVVLLVAAALALAGCATGAGRAATQAFSGTPAPIAASLDELETRYNGKAAYVMADVVSSTPATAEGKARQSTTKTALDVEHEQVLALLSDLREYLGVTKGSPEASHAAAQARWNAAVAAALTRLFPAPATEPAPAKTGGQ